MTTIDWSIKHFSLRLKSLYTRLTFNPWRRYIVYVGSPDFYPFNVQEKCFIHVLKKDSATTLKTFNILIDEDRFPFQTESIDMVICDLTDVPQAHLEQLLIEFQRILTLQGKLILTYNNRYSFYYAGNYKSHTYTAWKINALLKKQKIIVLKRFYQSFIIRKGPRWLQYYLIHYERFLRRFFKIFANKVTLFAVKETDFYQPLPAYLRLSKKIALNAKPAEA